MNNPNPLIPQGSLMDQKARGKPHLRIALCIVAVHVVFLGLLLMQGCKREEDPLSTVEFVPEEVPFGRLPVTSFYPTNDVVEDVAQVPVPEPRPVEPEAREPVERVERPVPPPPTPPPPVQVPQVREHTVQAGDTYTSIAREYETTVSAIARANPGVDPTRLRINQKLLVPPAEPAEAPAPAPALLPPGVEEYTVRSGDTLTSIASRHGTTVSAIRELNGLVSDRILVNQKLKIPIKNAGQ